MMRTFETYNALATALALEPLEAGAFRFAKQFAPAAFRCSVCQHLKPLNCEGCGGTGYSRDRDTNEFVCYECCGDRDVADMRRTGKATLYLSPLEGDRLRRYKVTNWPGTFQRNTFGAPRVSYHNIARKRYDVWFVGPDGYEWHGVQYGDNTQICHCKRSSKKLAEAGQ